MNFVFGACNDLGEGPLKQWGEVFNLLNRQLFEVWLGDEIRVRLNFCLVKLVDHNA